MSYYPAFINLKNKPCVVIGGGHVAFRKVNMLVDHEAKVTVISPQICNEIEEMVHNTVTSIKRKYQTGDLDGAFMVIAATDDQSVNEKVAHESMQKGILVNVVDVPSLSSFIVPSYINRGDLTIAVSTSGKSPAMARKIRIRLEEEFGPEFAELISIVDEIRQQLKNDRIHISADTWQQALNIEKCLDFIKSGKQAQLKLELITTLTEAGS